MTLKKLQTQFLSGILKNNTRIIKKISSSKNLSSRQQLQIYQNAYFERIIAAMSQDFPITKSFLGEGAFYSLVQDYINHYPSRDFNLRYIGKYLSDFLLQKDKSFAAFSDLAKLEYVMCETDKSEIHFESDFNVVDVYNIFHTENRLIKLIKHS
jgi:hypothetical protein